VVLQQTNIMPNFHPTQLNMQPTYTSQPISAPCISDQDIMLIGLFVKNLIMADVTQ